MTNQTIKRREKVQAAVQRNPGCMFLKAWFMHEAERAQVQFWTVVRRYYRGKYPHLKLERINARNVLVLNP